MGAGSREDSGDNHGEDQIAFAARMLIDELVEVPSSCKVPKDVGPWPWDGSGQSRRLEQEVGRSKGPKRSGKRRSERGQRERLARAAANFAVEAEGFAEEDRRRGVAVGDSGDVNAYDNITIIQRL